jgi:hypothetical protein
MYSVKIRKPGSIFSKTFKGVKGDGIIWFEDREGRRQSVQARYLILDDGRRVEIPFSIIIEFSPEREIEIRRNIEAVASGKSG